MRSVNVFVVLFLVVGSAVGSWYLGFYAQEGFNSAAEDYLGVENARVKPPAFTPPSDSVPPSANFN